MEADGSLGTHYDELTDDEEEGGMVTPHSHFSDSEQATPTFGEVADAARGQAQAGKPQAGDAGSLAPPEVRQRVLSDLAAERLRREAGPAGAAAAAEDEMLQLYSAARTATKQLHNASRRWGGGEGEGARGGRDEPTPTPRGDVQQGAHHTHHSSRDGGLLVADSEAEEAYADTPDAPSTGVCVCVPVGSASN